jgi:pimeloyl-ACP methyl ester carboxylesterase
MIRKPVLLFLHGLGCSARTWNLVIDELSDDFECLAVDLPGHGAAAESDQLTVEQMVDEVVTDLIARRPDSWALVGHSMGGKLAAIVAARTERGVAGLSRPFALMLVAASPLVPEPMDEAVRERMIGWCAAGSVTEPYAREFIDANTAGELPADQLAAAVTDVQRVSRTAWLAWLERGSREDWSDSVGVVRAPTLVVAGADDGDLGPDAQRRLVLPRVSTGDVVEVAGAAHLIMIEQPQQLASLIAGHARAALADRGLPADFTHLLGSDRVSGRTRQTLLDRVPEPAPGSGALSTQQRTVLDALLARVVPQRGTSIDLAARIDVQLATAVGDGWRFAELPDDAQAWRRGLDTLAAECDGFIGLSPADQDRCIERMVAGQLGSTGPGRLTSGQMTLWFEDVRAEAVRTWLSHPAALARIGYDGFAGGGDGVRMQGYLRTGADEREPWQRELPVHAAKQPAHASNQQARA